MLLGLMAGLVPAIQGDKSELWRFLVDIHPHSSRRSKSMRGSTHV